ncbi:DUF6233 domain-containing protein [Streptomyces sp. NPDC054794]
MFDDLPPDLDRLHTLRVWHAMWLARIDCKIAAIVKQQAEQEQGRQRRPRPPEWIIELGIGTGSPPTRVHAGDCHMAGKRRRPINQDEARRLLVAGTTACTHCHPDQHLGILDLATARCGARGQFCDGIRAVISRSIRTPAGDSEPSWAAPSWHRIRSSTSPRSTPPANKAVIEARPPADQTTTTDFSRRRSAVSPFTPTGQRVPCTRKTACDMMEAAHCRTETTFEHTGPTSRRTHRDRHNP